MKSSTDRNYNYRYKVSQNPEDVTSTTYQRRLLKKEQSHAEKFIFDLTEIPNSEFHRCHFILQKSNDPVFVHYSAELDLDPFKNRNKLIKVKTAEDYLRSRAKFSAHLEQIKYVFSPDDQKSAHNLSAEELKYSQDKIEWEFKNYNPKTKNSLTVADVNFFIKKGHAPSSEIPFWNSAIPAHYELESLEKPIWTFQTTQKNILISVIIPTYNNCMFLTNVIQHLMNQSMPHENYEIIIVDDGSVDHTQETIYSLIKTSHQNINIKYIYWSKKNALRGDQMFFRAGLARNLGVEHSEGSLLMFLDSDMLVSHDFIKVCVNALETNDVIQFSRLHIKQDDSQKNPRFHQIKAKDHTYIEEEAYWNQLFTVPEWNQLTDYWKYTCTYALGISKADFYECGRFKRHFVSYGFEDTDIGYRMAKKNKKFKLIQQHLLHLTNYSKMQYQNSKFLRDQLLRKTSKLMYLDHLDPEVFKAFHFYYNFEKSLIHHLRDVF